MRNIKVPSKSQKIGPLVVDFDYVRRVIYYRFFSVETTESRLKEAEKQPTIFEITFQTKDTSNHQWIDHFTFEIDKRMYEIGQDKRSDAFRFLLDKFEDWGGAPHMPGNNTTEKLKSLASYLRMAKHSVKNTLKEKEWGTWEDEHPDEVVQEEPEPKKTWAEATGRYEEFDEETCEEAKRILENDNFLKFMVDTVCNLVVGQRDKVTLVSLITLSSCVDDILHSLAMGSPASGKSTVGEHIYKVFPKHRRFEFTAESTVSGLINATRFADGSGVFRNKLLYLGDLGNEDQQKNLKVQEILAMLRILMEKKSFTKVLTDTKDDEHMPMVLTLDGCGSVMVECISKEMEGQFQDRCLRWSPNSGSDVTRAIDKFHNNELQKSFAEAKFHKNRRIVAAGIERIFAKVEDYSVGENGFKIYNPFNDFLFEKFQISGLVGNRGRKNVRTLPKLVALSNICKRDMFYNPHMEMHAIVVKPEDLLLVGIDLGKAIGYMLSPTPENVLAYIEKIEKEYVEPGEWLFTHNEYSRKFGEAWNGLTREERENEEKEFKRHLVTCNPITAKEMGELMNVQPDTARGYLNDLSDKGILYKKYTKGQENIYYPVRDFNIAKEEISAVYPKKSEVLEWRPELEKIYEDFIKEMEMAGFVKVDEPVLPATEKIVEGKSPETGIKEGEGAEK